jgi:hypothetical protein
MNVLKVWEGQVRNGEPSGFVRAISKDDHFIGYLANTDLTQLGTGLYFTYDSLKYSGVFQDQARYSEDAPQVQYEFTKFENYT